METIREVLKRRDGMSDTAIDELIRCAKDALQEYLEEGDIESAEDVCGEFFGLEPDYLVELM